MSRSSRPEDALLRELAAWGGTLRPGLERRGRLQTGDGLEVEVTIAVRRSVGPDQIREHRAEALALLRSRPEFVRHCGVNVERRSVWARGGKSIDSCKGRIVAAVVDGGGVYRFVCSRHREKHGLDLSRVLAVIELTPSELREAQKLDETQRFEWERKNLADDHERGSHRSGTYLQGFKPGASEEEIRRYWSGGRRIPPCPRCLEDAAAAHPTPAPAQEVH